MYVALMVGSVATAALLIHSSSRLVWAASGALAASARAALHLVPAIELEKSAA